jgi:hypothetical protein
MYLSEKGFSISSPKEQRFSFSVCTTGETVHKEYRKSKCSVSESICIQVEEKLVHLPLLDGSIHSVIVWEPLQPCILTDSQHTGLIRVEYSLQAAKWNIFRN